MTPGGRIESRILSKISVDGIGCWIFDAARDPHDYGRIHTPPGETALAHRRLYIALVGPIPDDLTLDHLCRVHACCNPDHLEPVTQRENTLRGNTIPAHAVAKTHCAHGHPFNERNTWRNPRNGVRQCRPCNARRQRETKLRRAARRALATSGVA
jgi:hypothetical protein